jgi:hypothetical protein
MTTPFRHSDAVRHVDDEADLLMFAVEHGMLTGKERFISDIYVFQGRLLKDGVIHEKRHASVLAGRGLPSPLDVMRKMSAEEFSALRKRVARALWFVDHQAKNSSSS